MKYCINCKFYKPHMEVADKTMGLCTYFPIKIHERYHIVSGELLESESYYESCSKARIFDNLCGKSGKYFVQRQQKNTL